MKENKRLKFLPELLGYDYFPFTLVIALSGGEKVATMGRLL
jgi:hypothetical protein